MYADMVIYYIAVALQFIKKNISKELVLYVLKGKTRFPPHLIYSNNFHINSRLKYF